MSSIASLYGMMLPGSWLPMSPPAALQDCMIPSSQPRLPRACDGAHFLRCREEQSTPKIGRCVRRPTQKLFPAPETPSRRNSFLPQKLLPDQVRLISVCRCTLQIAGMIARSLLLCHAHRLPHRASGEGINTPPPSRSSSKLSPLLFFMFFSFSRKRAGSPAIVGSRAHRWCLPTPGRHGLVSSRSAQFLIFSNRLEADSFRLVLGSPGTTLPPGWVPSFHCQSACPGGEEESPKVGMDLWLRLAGKIKTCFSLDVDD